MVSSPVPPVLFCPVFQMFCYSPFMNKDSSIKCNKFKWKLNIQFFKDLCKMFCDLGKKRLKFILACFYSLYLQVSTSSHIHIKLFFSAQFPLTQQLCCCHSALCFNLLIFFLWIFVVLSSFILHSLHHTFHVNEFVTSTEEPWFSIASWLTSFAWGLFVLTNVRISECRRRKDIFNLQ